MHAPVPCLIDTGPLPAQSLRRQAMGCSESIQETKHKMTGSRSSGHVNSQTGCPRHTDHEGDIQSRRLWVMKPIACKLMGCSNLGLRGHTFIARVRELVKDSKRKPLTYSPLSRLKCLSHSVSDQQVSCPQNVSQTPALQCPSQQT